MSTPAAPIADAVPTVAELLANPRLGLITGADLARLIRESGHPATPTAAASGALRRSLRRARDDAALLAGYELSVHGAAGAFLDDVERAELLGGSDEADSVGPRSSAVVAERSA